MSILAWIILGLVAGSLAGLAPGVRGRGALGPIVAGTLGAVIGGFLGSALLGLEVSDLNATSLVVAAIGAVVLLAVLRAVPGSQPFE